MSIQSELTRLENAKSEIKAAIEGKGVTVPDTTLLDGMAALIESIGAGAGGGMVETGKVYPSITPHNDSNPLKISLSFEPDFLFIHMGDASTKAPEPVYYVTAGLLVRDTMSHELYSANYTLTDNGFNYGIEGLYGSSVNHAEYRDGILYWVLCPQDYVFSNGYTYTWIARKW